MLAPTGVEETIEARVARVYGLPSCRLNRNCVDQLNPFLGKARTIEPLWRGIAAFLKQGSKKAGKDYVTNSGYA
jgi:hypothetical protein